MLTSTTHELVQAYYDSWTDGIDSFDEARLRTVLAPDLHFEGPIAGKRDRVEPFLFGLADFVKRMTSYRRIQHVHSGSEASALYECTLTGSEDTIRFAEFFRVKDDKIQELTLLYDAAEFRRLAGLA